jgi:hypothetical protein
LAHHLNFFILPFALREKAKGKGRSYLLAHRPNFFILPFAFLLLPAI